MVKFGLDAESLHEATGRVPDLLLVHEADEEVAQADLASRRFCAGCQNRRTHYHRMTGITRQRGRGRFAEWTNAGKTG
jgi:hypothetical protein